MSRGWTAAAAAAILATVAALAFLGIARAQSVSDLTVGSATVEPGGTVTVEIRANVDTLGAYGINVVYDGDLVTATDCSSSSGSCNTEFGINTVRLNGVDPTLEGFTDADFLLGSITFLAGTTEGVADLTIDDVEVADEEGTTFSVTSQNDGAITIATATAAPTDEPTPTPGAVPATGGAPGTSSANSMAWLLAAAGLTIVAGGAWVLARAGREN